MMRARGAPLFMSSVWIEKQKRSMDRDRDQIRTFIGTFFRLDQSERVRFNVFDQSESCSIHRVIRSVLLVASSQLLTNSRILATDKFLLVVLKFESDSIFC